MAEALEGCDTVLHRSLQKNMDLCHIHMEKYGGKLFEEKLIKVIRMHGKW